MATRWPAQHGLPGKQHGEPAWQQLPLMYSWTEYPPAVPRIATAAKAGRNLTTRALRWVMGLMLILARNGRSVTGEGTNLAVAPRAFGPRPPGVGHHSAASAFISLMSREVSFRGSKRDKAPALPANATDAHRHPVIP